jgi:hypothetical protein
MGHHTLDSIFFDRFQIVQHRKLSAATEERAGTAVGANLFRQPDVRYDRKSQAGKIRRLMSEGAKAIEQLAPRLLSELLGDAPPDAETAMVPIDHEGSDLGQRMAQRSQLPAGNDPVAMDGHEKAVDVALQLTELPRQEAPLLEM